MHGCNLQKDEMPTFLGEKALFFVVDELPRPHVRFRVCAVLHIPDGMDCRPVKLPESGDEDAQRNLDAW
jgi:hypothetical protein